MIDKSIHMEWVRRFLIPLRIKEDGERSHRQMNQTILLDSWQRVKPINTESSDELKKRMHIDNEGTTRWIVYKILLVSLQL